MSTLFSRIQLSISPNLPLFIIIAILSIIFTFFIYRRTNPIVNNFTRWLLILFRVSALFLLLFCIFEMTIGYMYERTKNPSLAIAIDNSASMNIKDSNGQRADIINKVLSSNELKSLTNTFNLNYYTFSSQAKPFHYDTDSLNYISDETNITKSLQLIKGQLADQNLAGIILLSDGNYNSGGNPARFISEINTPVYPVGIGSSEPVPDLTLANMESNPFAYLGEPTPIKAIIQNRGFSKLKVNLTLKNQDKTLTTKIVDIPPSPSEIQTQFDFVPQIKGMQKLELVLSPIENEETIENNRQFSYIDVLKSRLNILIIAGHVSPEISFLRRHLNNSKRYDVNVIYQIDDGKLSQYKPVLKQANNLDDVDIFIFLNYPTLSSDTGYLNKLYNSIKSSSKPVLLFLDHNTDLKKLARFEDYLAINPNGSKIPERDVFISLSTTGQSHQIMQIKSNSKNFADEWAKLPPVNSSLRINQIMPNSETLAFAVTSTNSRSNINNGQDPMIVIRADDLNKSATIIASDLWRWDLIMAGIGESESIYGQFVNNIIRWLQSSKQDELVRIKTDKQKYHLGDGTKIQIQVHDEKYLPMNDANVKINIIHKNKNNHHQFLAENHGDGKYFHLFFPTIPGDYRIYVSAESNKKTIGQDSTLISVGEYSKELTHTSMQKATLVRLANLSNGKFITPDSLSLLTETIKGQIQKEQLSNETSIWNNEKILIILIFLLSVEWFIRKRKGMV